MYELNQVGDHTYYIESGAKIGVYVDGADAVLIDSGNDKEAGRKINQHLKAQGWNLRCILNTHSNADHIGGNAFLQSRTGCIICSTGLENAFAQYPILEGSFLFGGYPPKPLRNKFLMAQPSIAPISDFSCLPKGLTTIPLPGHFFDMIGVRTVDDVVFLADALSAEHILEKYHVNYIYDVAAYLETLDLVSGMQAKLFIPSHGEPTADIRPLAAANRAKVQEIASLVLSLCKAPITAEELYKKVFDHYGLAMNFNQYVLVGSTLKNYLAYHLDAGRVEAEFLDNRLLWRAVS